MKTVAFFGHSMITNINEVKRKLNLTIKDITAQGFLNFLVGCHGDFDKTVLSCLINFKELTNNNVKITVVLTNLSLLSKNYYSVLDYYNDNGIETLYYDIENVYFKNRITFSNKKMVDSSDLIICYVKPKLRKSGAKTAINYAIRQNKRIINLYNE